LDDYLKGRIDVGATRKLFEYFHAFDESPEEADDEAFGFSVIVRKWPLRDLDNWAPLRGWHFAVAEERSLLKKLESTLSKCVKDEPATMARRPVPLEAEALLAEAIRLSEQLTQDGFNPGAIVYATPIPTDTMVALQERIDTRKRDLDPSLRTNWILGRHKGLLLLYAAGASTHRMYAVDIPSFGRLVQFSPNAELSIDDAPVDIALRAKAADPYNSVRLRLYQSYEVQVRDCGAVRAAPIEQIPYDQ